MTQIYIKQNIHKHRTQNFRRISPFGITPVEKAHKASFPWATRAVLPETPLVRLLRLGQHSLPAPPGPQRPFLLPLHPSLPQRRLAASSPSGALLPAVGRIRDFRSAAAGSVPFPSKWFWRLSPCRRTFGKVESERVFFFFACRWHLQSPTLDAHTLRQFGQAKVRAEDD